MREFSVISSVVASSIVGAAFHFMGFRFDDIIWAAFTGIIIYDTLVRRD